MKVSGVGFQPATETTSAETSLRAGWKPAPLHIHTARLLRCDSEDLSPEVGERRFSALVFVDAGDLQTVETSALRGVDHRLLQTVVTEEPVVSAAKDNAVFVVPF